MVESGNIRAGESGRDEAEQPHRGTSQRNPESATGNRQHQTFGENEADELRAAGSQSQANHHFALALIGAGKQQVGDICAGDQEDGAYGAHKNQEQGTNSPGELIVQGDEIGAVPGIRVWMLFLDLAAQHIHIAGGLRERNVGPQSSGSPRNDGRARSTLSCGVKTSGQEEIRRPSKEESEFGGHDADDLVRFVVQADGSSEDGRHSTKVRLPKLIREHGHASGARLVCGGEGPAEQRRDSVGWH